MGMERRRREEVHSGEGGVDAMTGNSRLRAPKLDRSTATACAQRGITVRVGGGDAGWARNGRKVEVLTF